MSRYQIVVGDEVGMTGSFLLRRRGVVHCGICRGCSWLGVLGVRMHTKSRGIS